MAHTSTMIVSPTSIRSEHKLTYGLFGGGFALYGGFGVAGQLSGTDPWLWPMFGAYLAMFVLGFAAFATLLARRLTVVDPEGGEVRLELAVPGMSVVSETIPLEHITDVSLHPEMRPDENVRTFTGDVFGELDDRCVIDLEMNEQTEQVEISSDYEGARRRAERLAAALDVTLIDTVRDEDVHTAPEELGR